MLRDGADVSAGRINHQTDMKVRLRVLELGWIPKAESLIPKNFTSCPRHFPAKILAQLQGRLH